MVDAGLFPQADQLGTDAFSGLLGSLFNCLITRNSSSAPLSWRMKVSRGSRPVLSSSEQDVSTRKPLAEKWTSVAYIFRTPPHCCALWKCQLVAIHPAIQGFGLRDCLTQLDIEPTSHRQKCLVPTATRGLLPPSSNAEGLRA